MRASHRPVLRRFILALGGVLAIMMAGFVGLGWMVARQQNLAWKILGYERTQRIWEWYLPLVADLAPGDRDGDLLCDGAEWWCGSDPNNPAEHVMARAEFECLLPFRAGVAYCGERITTRWVQTLDKTRVRWPKGFTVMVTADQPILLPKNAPGRPTTGPLIVTVNRRGELEFDILVERPFKDIGIWFADPVTGNFYNLVKASAPGWPRPPIPCTVSDYGPDGLDSNGELSDELKWTAPAGWTGSYAIEAARTGRRA